MGQVKKSKARTHSTATKVWKSVELSVPLVDGVSAKYENSSLIVTGPKGEVSKKLRFPKVSIVVEGNAIKIMTNRFSKSLKKIMFTYQAHIKNLVLGVQEGFEYSLKVVYAKFPMTVEYKNQELIVKNFLGEKVPRIVRVPDNGVKVEVKGENITISGIDKESCGLVAALIEQSTRINHLDRRVVQDGIFITKKPHKEYA